MGLAKRFHSLRLHSVFILAAVCCLVGSLGSVELLVLPSQEAGAATDVVTSCSGDPSVPGSLPNEVGSAGPGDTITFAVPSCSTITLSSRLDVSGLTIDGPGPNFLTVGGDGETGILSSGTSGTTEISGLTIDSGEGTSSGGGGISNNGATLVISNCVFSNNSSESYGGAIWSGGSLTVSDTTFIGNSSQNEGAGGGAVLVASGTAGVSDSTFVNNATTGVGGAILNEGNLTIANSTFNGNFTPAFGGAIENAGGGTTAIKNSTLAGDEADSGGGEVENTAGGTMTIQATILADSFPADCEAIGAITDLGYNLDDDSSCGFDAPTSLSNADPDLDPSGLQNNGGLTQTIALETGSAAIGAVTEPSQCPATDQRGVPRPTTCDIGAYESIPPPTISSVTFAGSRSSPTVTVSGSGFGSESDLGTPTAPWVCGSTTGLNYGNGFYFSDGTDLPEGSWQAGKGPNDCVGVLISSYSNSQVTFTFGSDYSSFPGVRTGDGISMTVLGTTFNGVASLETGTAYVIDGSDVTPVNLATNHAGTPISFGGGSQPSAIAINPRGTVAYVADAGLGTVDPITLATNSPGTPIPVGGPDSNSVPKGIAISPDGQTAYVANQNGTVDPVNLVTDTAESLITIPESSLSAIAISPDGQSAYVTDLDQGQVYPITLATETVGASIGLGEADAAPDSIAITPDGSKAFVVTHGNGSLIPIDLSTDTAGSPNDDPGTGAQYVVISPDGSTVYVSNSTEDDNDIVWSFDTATNSTQNGVSVDSTGSGSIAIAPDGSTIYAGSSGHGLTAIPTDIFDAGTASPVCNNFCGQLAIAPDQAPVAALSVNPGSAGSPTTFDASASVAGSTPIVDYAWDFGDGHTADTAMPSTTHTYASSGTYTSSVTETDAAGTSTTQVFTGQTVSRNGGSQAKASSTFNVGPSFTCTVSGMSGTTSFPVVESESPAPPSSIDAGGTFLATPSARVTIPASVLNHFRNLGATSLTVASQSTAIDGRTSVGGPLSGAVSPAVETASASNLPQSHSPLLVGVPYTYSTTYNPVTFQTGPGTGKVYLTPGPISASVTFVIHNTPTPETISCSPPSGVAALGSTTVNPPPATPTFQVPGSTPPLQNQVSAGSDGGWGATIADTSTASVTGLVAHVSVSDGGGPVSFDLTGMAASGTNCSGAGSGKLTCGIGTLTAGASSTLNLLVTTNGLSGSVAISGSATISSSNAGSHATTLSTIGVVVVQAGNGTKAVATPGTALVSTKRPLKTAKASVSLTLPKAKITKKPSAGGQGSTSSAGTSIVNPPPVAVTLESLTPSAEPALCPPSGSLKCEGNIVQIFGNFSAYTSKLHPIVTVVKFFYGLKVPAGSVYFLKPNGKTVKKLSACKKTSTGYVTPCVFGKEQILGSAAHDSLYAQDTVYFTGNDPAMGRR